jgi:hypothetical protein
MVKQTALKAGLLAAGVALVGAIGMGTAEARTFVSVGIGVPLFGPPVYAYPPPVYAYSPYYYPPSVVVAPTQAPTSYVTQGSSSWYYCDNPQGYYPYVQNCSTAWRQVPANPQSAPPAQ